jgi:1-phosphatidylinositol phosphodiesterase
MWRLQRDDGLDDRSNRWASWMHNVPDDTRLSMLNIPGTHQSIALHGIAVSDNPRCQNRPPYEQLCEGIRYLDLRFDRWMGSNEQPSLYARHGVASMGFSLAAVLQSLKIFLQQFPSEVVFISVSNETGTDGFQESWQNDFRFFKDIFFTNGSDQRPRMADLTLGQVRGKVVCHNDGLIWKWGPPWQGS